MGGSDSASAPRRRAGEPAGPRLTVTSVRRIQCSVGQTVAAVKRWRLACIWRTVSRSSCNWQLRTVRVKNTPDQFGRSAAKPFKPAINRARHARVRRHSQKGQSRRLQSIALRIRGSPRCSSPRGISNPRRVEQWAMDRPTSTVSGLAIRALVIGLLYLRCLVNLPNGSD